MHDVIIAVSNYPISSVDVRTSPLVSSNIHTSTRDLLLRELFLGLNQLEKLEAAKAA